MNIYDIASKAGVSIATVSRVLNNSQKVSSESRERIFKIMEAEGYVPNAFARGLGLNTMKMVGVMCTDVADPFYAGAVGNIERLLRENGLDTVLCCTGNELSRKKQALKELVNRRVDAVILIGSAFREKQDNSHIKEAAKSIPVEIINGNILLPGVYCVYCDERKAAKRTVFSFYKSGCKNIVYLYDAETYSGLEKLGGYKDGCHELALCEHCFKIEKTVKAAEQAITAASDSGIKIDAVMASEDLLAAGAQNALKRLKIKTAVVGFNNSIIAECASPSLTSIDNMCLNMCETAVKNLMNLANGVSVPQETVVSAQIEQRESFKTDKW